MYSNFQYYLDRTPNINNFQFESNLNASSKIHHHPLDTQTTHQSLSIYPNSRNNMIKSNQSKENLKLEIQVKPLQKQIKFPNNLNSLEQNSNKNQKKKKKSDLKKIQHTQQDFQQQKEENVDKNYYTLSNRQYNNYKYIRSSCDILDVKNNTFKLKNIQETGITTKNDKLEKTISNLREIQTRTTNIDEIDPSFLQINRQKMINDKVHQHRETKNPFIQKQRIFKNLNKLDNQVQKMIFEDKFQTVKWQPPLQKFQDVDVYGQTSKKYTNNKEDELFINVLHFNQAFQGHGNKLKCLFENHERSNTYSGLQMNREVVHKVLNKNYCSNIVIDEYNRLLKIDKINKSKIAPEKQQNMQQTDQENLLKETFLNYSNTLYQYIKNDKQIIDRILWALQTENETLDFESINNFYKILIFKNSSYEENITFIAKFIRYKGMKLSIYEILEVISLLTQEIDQQIEKYNQNYKNTNQLQFKRIIYEENLKQKGYMDNLDKTYRLSEIEKIFSSGVININEIFSLFYCN